MDDTYRTIAGAVRTEQKVIDSRFIAEAFPVGTEEAAAAKIEAVRKRAHKATHHCTAYRIGPDGARFRYNDDGEPSGTAGPPILQQIHGRELTNTLVVVTRYFGGTKLGTGGLVRAYGGAAAAVLDAATIVKHVERIPVRVRFAYDDTAPARQLLRRFDVTRLDEAYGVDTAWTLGVRRSEVEPFVAAFTDALGGRGEIVRVGEA